MKKRILSAVALTMTMALTLGMTAFAAESPVVKDNTVSADPVKTVITEVKDEAVVKEAATLSNGVVVEGVDSTAPVSAGELVSAKEVATKVATAQAGANKTVTVKVVAAVDVEDADFVAGSVLEITVPVAPKTGMKYAVMHYTDTAWEFCEAEYTGKTVKVKLDSLSPIVLVEIEEKAVVNNNNNNNTPETPAAPAESPKTGEVASVAGILALVCLAGAAVSAKKVCYNR